MNLTQKPFFDELGYKLTTPDKKTSYSSSVYYFTALWKRSIFGPKLPTRNITTVIIRCTSTEPQYKNAEETLLKQLEKIDSKICEPNQPESYWDKMKREKRKRKGAKEKQKQQAKAEKKPK